MSRSGLTKKILMTLESQLPPMPAIPPNISNALRPKKLQYYGAFNLPQLPKTSLQEKVENLTFSVFTRGNCLLKRVVKLEHLPEGRHSFPEVCFVGIGGAGKSSLCGQLLNNNNMVFVSHRPGSSKYITFFNVGDCILIADTPTFGGAQRLSASEACQLNALILQYISIRRGIALKQVYYVVDASRGLVARDFELLEFLGREKVRLTVVLNKVDLLKGGLLEIQRKVDTIYSYLGSRQVPVIETSALHGWNISSLRHDIMLHCCQDLTEHQLDVKHLKELSYSAPSVEVQLATEARFPRQNYLFPPNDDVPQRLWLRRRAQIESEILDGTPYNAMADLVTSTMTANADLCLPVSVEGNHEVPLFKQSLQRKTDGLDQHDQNQGKDDALMKLTPEVQPLLHESKTAPSFLCSPILRRPIRPDQLNPTSEQSAIRLGDAAPSYIAAFPDEGADALTNSSTHRSKERFVARMNEELAAAYSPEMNYFVSRTEDQPVKSKSKLRWKRRIEKYGASNLDWEKPFMAPAQQLMCPWLGRNRGSNSVIGTSYKVNEKGGLVKNLKSYNFGGNNYTGATKQSNNSHKVHKFARHKSEKNPLTRGQAKSKQN